MATVSTSSSTRVSSNVSPLTTTFTPPPPCFSLLTAYYWVISNDNTAGGGIGFPLSTWYSGGTEGGIPTSTCYPSSFASIAYFSPGICPSGYSAGCVTTTALSGSSNTETRAICCPSNWFCDTETTTQLGDVIYARPWIASYPCAYYPSGVVSVRTAFTEFRTASGIEVNAKGVSIRWQNTDSLPSAIVISTSPRITSSSSTGNSSTLPQPPSSPGLSGEAKAGIGVGVAAVVLFFFLVLAFFVVRKRRGKKKEGQDTTGHEYLGKPELDAAAAKPKAELEDTADNKARGELGESGPVAGEMEAPTKAELAGSQPVVHEIG